MAPAGLMKSWHMRAARWAASSVADTLSAVASTGPDETGAGAGGAALCGSGLSGGDLGGGGLRQGGLAGAEKARGVAWC